MLNSEALFALLLEASQNEKKLITMYSSLLFKKAQYVANGISRISILGLHSCLSLPALQMIDLLIALCLAKITVLHRKEQVQMYVSTTHDMQSAPLFLLATIQVDSQVAEQGSYGNGVESILVRDDPSLPLFVAIV